MQVIDVQVEVAAPAERMFAVLAEHESMWRWSPGIKSVELDPPGPDDRNGIGAVRRIQLVAGGVVLREEVVGWLPPHWYEYRVIGRAPIRDHLGRVEVTPLGDDRCKARWRIEFRSRVPGLGPLIRIGFRAAIKQMLDNAKSLAERNEGPAAAA